MSRAGLILLVCSAIAFLEFAFLLFRSMRREGDDTSRRRLRKLATRLKDVAPQGSETSIIRDDRDGVPVAFRWLNVRLALRLVRAIDMLLYRSSLSIGTTRFVAVSLSIGAFAALGGLELFLRWDVAIACGLLASILPASYAYMRASRRLNSFEEDFPEALALVARSMRGGHALQSSLRIVAEEMQGPVSAEFSLLSDELSMGRDLENVLQDLCHRTGLSDVYLFSVGVMIQRDVGGNMAEVVEKLATMIRERFKFQARVRSMTTMNRSSALVLLVIPFVFIALMSVSNPEFVSPLWNTEQGQILGIVSGLLSFGGYFVALRMASVEG